MMMVVKMVIVMRRCPSGIGIWLHGGTPWYGPIGLFGMGTRWSCVESSIPWRRGTLNNIHWTPISLDLNSLQSVQTIIPTTANDGVDAEADLGLWGHRDDWRRRERHHRKWRNAQALPERPFFENFESFFVIGLFLSLLHLAGCHSLSFWDLSLTV